jgi:glycosyltransferase involved in cell wall biosynthesis
MTALADGLLRQGYGVRILELQGVAPGQSTFKDEMTALGVPVHHASEFAPPPAESRDYGNSLPLDAFASILPPDAADLAGKVAEAIRRLRPGVVHCWSDFSNVVGGFVAARLAVPRIILGLRVMPPPFWYPADQAELYRTAYQLLAADSAAVFVSNSRVSARAYEDWLPLRRGSVRVVYNGFLASGIRIRGRTARAECRMALGLPEHGPVIAAVMRLAEEKDPDLWLDTAAAIAAARPDATFIIAGYGHEGAVENLSRRTVELGLAGRVLTPGATNDVGEVYGAGDLLLLTSRTENVPNVMIEAQAAGIPVVGPNVGGISEAMLHGVTGLLVRERSAQGLAAAVLQIVNESRWADRVSQLGPKFVSDRFGHERMVRETIAIYHHGAAAWLRLASWPRLAMALWRGRADKARVIRRSSARFERMRRLGDAGLPNVEHQLKEIRQAAR